MRDIRSAIIEAMEARHLTAYRLARMARLSPQTVANALTREAMSSRTAEALMRALGLEVTSGVPNANDH